MPLNGAGSWCDNEAYIKAITFGYFREIFKSQGTNDTNGILNAVEAKVLIKMNTFLLGKYNVEEIHNAIKQMHPTKVSGLDGMPAIFYQKFWFIVCNDVVSFCLEFLNGDKSLDAINHASVVVIPKIKEPRYIT